MEEKRLRSNTSSLYATCLLVFEVVELITLERKIPPLPRGKERVLALEQRALERIELCRRQ